MSRPMVLLDVDGVLNAPGARTVWEDARSGVAEAEGRSFRIRFSPQVVAAVRGWTTHADVRWLTTWGHAANGSLRQLLELPELPVAGTHDGAPPTPAASGEEPETHADVAPAAPDPLDGHWWKFDVVRGLVAADPSRSIIWIDDDLAAGELFRPWLADHPRVHPLAPDPAVGLSPQQLRAVGDLLGMP